jgi:hypothetical protein
MSTNDIDGEGPTTISGSIGAGETHEYYFGGRVDSFASTKQTVVRVDGRERPDLSHAHRLRVQATGSLTNFEASVSGRLAAGSEADIGGSGLGADTIAGRTVSGAVDNDGYDDFYFDGELIRFERDGDLEVYVNGEQVDPDAIGSDDGGDEGDGSDGSDESENGMADGREHELVLSSSDGGADYDLRLSEGEVLEADDDISDDRLQATGTVWEGFTDYIIFTGIPESLTADPSLTAKLNGETVAPEDVGEIIGGGSDGAGETTYSQSELDAAVEEARSKGYDNGYEQGYADGEADARVTVWNNALEAVREVLPDERSADDSGSE